MTVIVGKCELNVRASECSQAVPGLVLATPSSRLACKMEKRCPSWEGSIVENPGNLFASEQPDSEVLRQRGIIVANAA